MWPVPSKWTCWWYNSKLSYWYQFKEHILSFKMVNRWRKSDFGNWRYEFTKHIYSYYFLYISRTLLAYISKQCLPTTCPFLTRRVTYMLRNINVKEQNMVILRSLIGILQANISLLLLIDFCFLYIMQKNINVKEQNMVMLRSLIGILQANIFHVCVTEWIEHDCSSPLDEEKKITRSLDTSSLALLLLA